MNKKKERILECSVCHRKYNSTFQQDNGVCPICVCKIHGRTSILERMENRIAWRI